jgi:hypothetical protein
MVEERDKGRLVVKGLHEEAETLDNYWIDSETDLGQHDLGV